MLYTSTRDKTVHVTSAQAIARGISADGGLFVPEEIPQISASLLQELSGLNYISRAKRILALYLTDFTAEEIDRCVRGAYAPGKFSSEKVSPLHTIADGAHVLELWRGPTCAFKDMALQLLPYLLTTAAKKTVADKTIVILVATSGDTGKAALAGFCDVPGTKIMVFYPNDGVSPMQKLQMTTQEGGNVCVCAINGNFDDAQNGVKAIFTDPAVAEKLAQHGMMFSSANSINWGRLVPQIVYYVSAYCDLIAEGAIKNGDAVNIVVPTGNFGNILAAYYAKEMGVPVKTLLCASNANNVLTEFLETGVYDRNRPFFTTTSPSMDILISSNLERLLF
ncbi:MAG: threonine synthase, partial [Clostridia bacterium]|nr:threonine synthase [Clostridia bacterium]